MVSAREKQFKHKASSSSTMKGLGICTYLLLLSFGLLYFVNLTEAAVATLSGFVPTTPSKLIPGAVTASLSLISAVSAKFGGTMVVSGTPVAGCYYSSVSPTAHYLMYALDDIYTKMVLIKLTLIGGNIYVEATGAGYIPGK